MQNDSRLDAYLAEIEKRLGAITPQQRTEEMREVRLHLEMLTAQYEENGITDAEQEAIRQFGRPAEIAGKILRVWRRGQRGSFAAAVLFAFALTFMAESLIWNMPVCGLLSITVTRDGSGVHSHLPQTLHEILPTVFCGLFCFFGAGILFGRRCRGSESLRGAGIGFLSQRLISSLSILVFVYQSVADWPHAATIGREYDWALGLLACDLLAFPIAGLIGTAFGQRQIVRKQSRESLPEVAARYLTLSIPLSCILSSLAALLFRLLIKNPHTISCFYTGSSILLSALSFVIPSILASRRAGSNIAPKILLTALGYELLVTVPSAFVLCAMYPAKIGTYIVTDLRQIAICAIVPAVVSAITWCVESRRRLHA